MEEGRESLERGKTEGEKVEREVGLEKFRGKS